MNGNNRNPINIDGNPFGAKINNDGYMAFYFIDRVGFTRLQLLNSFLDLLKINRHMPPLIISSTVASLYFDFDRLRYDPNIRIGVIEGRPDILSVQYIKNDKRFSLFSDM